MQFKVMPLCLGLGVGMIVMKLICLKQESMEDQCILEECQKDKCETSCKEKAKDKITQIVQEIEKLEMSDIKAKTKETLGQIKSKILSIHL